MHFTDSSVSECRITSHFVVLSLKSGEKRVLDPTPDEYKQKFDELWKKFGPENSKVTTDFSARWGDARLRCQFFHSNHGWNLVVRKMDWQIMPLHQLGFKDPHREIMPLIRGKNLTLFCGEMNSGKSTTLAAAAEALSQENLRGECVTIEHPVERLYEDPLVSQREVGVDVATFADGIHDAVRQSANTIIVGEIRSREEAHQAVEAGLIGIRVLATMHAGCIEEALSRMWAFLDDSHDDILMSALQGIVVQYLARNEQHTKLLYESLHVDEQVRRALMHGPEDLAAIKNLMYAQGRRSIEEQVQRELQAGSITSSQAQRWVKRH